MKIFVVSPTQKLSGELRVASDKSISHRAVMLSALAEGETTIANPLLGEDVVAAVNAMRACGADIAEERGELRARGAGGAMRSPAADIDCGNSGTLMRLFCGIAVGRRLSCKLVGDKSLMRRPMRRVVDPLAKMGAQIKANGKGAPPVVISPAGDLRGLLHSNRLSSAQVKSALLLAGLGAAESVVIAEPIASRDHSERMLAAFGARLRRSEDGRVCEIRAGELRSPGRVDVPADISSAMFFLVGAAISPGSDALLTEVGVNPTRIGGLELLMRMGADINIANRRDWGAEPVADIRVRGGELHGIDIGADMVPSAIDDFPALFIAAAAARGVTRLSGAGELRHKESDRLSAMAAGLEALDVECEEQADGIAIVGGGGEGKRIFSGGNVDATGDHRVAMAFCMAALRAKGDIAIRDCENVRTSFPNFVKLASAAGIRIVEDEAPDEEEGNDGE